MKNVKDVLDKLYRQGSFEGEHREIHPDRIEEAIQELKELMPSEEEIEKCMTDEAVRVSKIHAMDVTRKELSIVIRKLIEERLG